MLLETTSIPFIPWHWGKNQKGMQASEECNELIVPQHWIGDGGLTREQAWLQARDGAVDMAEGFMQAGYHKQIPNRLLEPFSWIDTLVTSTDWDNFLWLREHGDAEPHLQDLAALVHQAIEAAEIQKLEPGEWHLPYITQDDSKEYKRRYESGDQDFNFLMKISAARCARISYKPFNGDASYERELERYDSLVTADRVHASPLEHQASPDMLCYIAIQEKPGKLGFRREWIDPKLHGNFDGYIQYRKTIPNEAKMEGVL